MTILNLTPGIIIFDILSPRAFRKYITPIKDDCCTEMFRSNGNSKVSPTDGRTYGRTDIGRTSRLRLGVSAKALAKFWRLIGFRKYLFLFTIIKSRSVSFQPCITLGGVHWVKMGQNNDFLQKSGLKTLILAVMVLDQLTSEWARTHNFKRIANFHRCFENSGTSASIWAMRKASNFNIVRL